MESDYPPPPPGPPPGPPGPPQMHPYPPGMGYQRPPMPYPPMGGPPPRPGSGYGGYGQAPVPRLPPGPPPRLPQGVPPRMGMRPPGMPPPPPPGANLSLTFIYVLKLAIHGTFFAGLRAGTRPPMSGMGPSGVGGGSVAAKPSTSAGKPMTVIEAKPQMRNLSADLTRFVPTTLKLKKEAPVAKKAPDTGKAAPRIEWRVPQPPQVSIIGNQLIVNNLDDLWPFFPISGQSTCCSAATSSRTDQGRRLFAVYEGDASTDQLIFNTFVSFVTARDRLFTSFPIHQLWATRIASFQATRKLQNNKNRISTLWD